MLITDIAFGTAMAFRLAARLLLAVSYLLEAAGVLAFTLVLGWLEHHIMAVVRMIRDQSGSVSSRAPPES